MTVDLLRSQHRIDIESAPTVAARLVFDELERARPIRRLKWRGRLRVAACTLLFLLPVLLLVEWSSSRLQPPREVSASEQAILEAHTWLASVQEPSGAWSPSRFGGNDEYRIVLTSLAALSIAADRRPNIREHAMKAGDYLCRSQEPSGHLGPQSPTSLYSHSVGTLALVELTRLDPSSPNLRQSLERAVRYLEKAQTPQGGWGALPVAGTCENEAVGFWALEALTGAQSLGVAVGADVVENGRRWFANSAARAQQQTRDTSYGSRTGTSAPIVYLVVLENAGGKCGLHEGRALSALEAYSVHAAGAQLCVYDAYFLTRTPALVDYRTQTNQLLVNTQARTGAHSGSWDLRDQWSSVGGRLYSTTFATLALQNSIETSEPRL